MTGHAVCPVELMKYRFNEEGPVEGGMVVAFGRQTLEEMGKGVRIVGGHDAYGTVAVACRGAGVTCFGVPVDHAG